MDSKILVPVLAKAKEIGAAFHSITFEKICDSLIGVAKDHETHLNVIKL